MFLNKMKETGNENLMRTPSVDLALAIIISL